MNRMLPDGPLVAWYGDDYTGAASVMEVLTFSGLPSVLFLDVPTPEFLARFPDARGIGIAGTARSQRTEWMEEHLPHLFAALADIGAPIVHYKICSTLDSAPHIGSIGRVAEIGIEVLNADWASLLVAAPAIGRYQAFGNLFAAAAGEVHRLDRHPVMARHPVTPMDEADVCRHIARQTDLATGLVPLDALHGDPDQKLADEQARGARIIALDTVDDATLAQAGRLIWESGKPHFTIGSQGVEYALVKHWQDDQFLSADPSAPRVDPTDNLAVVAGSVSPTTDRQIGWALKNGFSGLRLDPRGALLEGPDRENWVQTAIDAAIATNASPLAYTARGPDDPAIAAFRTAAQTAGLSPDDANARLGASLGDILAGIMARTGWTRAVIAGGDTSSHAAQRLGIVALTAIAATVPGAALCQAHRDPADDGFEIALKGGQMGTPDFFGRIRNGGPPR